MCRHYDAHLWIRSNPAVQHICPRLEHRFPLLCILRLVVDRAHATLFVSEAFLDPVGVEPCFVQQRAGRPTQIVHRERIKICPVVAYQLDRAVNDPVRVAALIGEAVS